MNNAGVSLVLSPQWASLTIELTLAVPGPQGSHGERGERGEVGPQGPAPDITTLALDAGYF